MSLDVLFLSRLQFALTIMYHYLFPPLSIGLGAILVFMEGMYLKTKNHEYETMARFWTRIFAVNFAMGVATGIVMEFEFGTNWATYARYVGDIFGSLLAVETRIGSGLFFDVDHCREVQDGAAHKDDEGREEHASREVELIGRYDDGHEHDENPDDCRQTARRREILVDGPNQHAAAQILSEPRPGQQNEPRHEQPGKQKYETLDNLVGEIRVEDVYPQQDAAQQDAPINRLSHQMGGAQASGRVHQEGDAAQPGRLISAQPNPCDR